MLGNKITKKILYSEYLDIKPYLSPSASKNISEECMYQLYAVVVHEYLLFVVFSGMTVSSGHYYSFVRGSNKFWYCYNDSSKQIVNINTVLNQNIYILMYRIVDSSLLSKIVPMEEYFSF